MEDDYNTLQEPRKRSKGKDRIRGRLKIFFGYAAGVGKTYTMLEEAHALKRQGVDVVAGYIQPHARPETEALLQGLETLPVRTAEYKGTVLKEFDLDRAMERSPQVILIDELAHTNAQGSRHLKRYQDIDELLNAGIDVYTTVNVQHIESLNDIIASITGVRVRERIPDKVFDSADQVQLVDIEPDGLLERLRTGKIYKPRMAERAEERFFSLTNLTALREIALRRMADRMNRLAEKQKKDHYIQEHILVCLSSSPSNGRLIRTAARMADAFKSRLTALFVETPAFKNMGKEDRARLREHVKLAQQLGASVETVYGEDIVFQISEYARLAGVSKIVMGQSNHRRAVFFRQTLTDRLIAMAPDIDVYIIPGQDRKKYSLSYKKKIEKLSWRDSLISLGILAGTTAVNIIFFHIGFSDANIIMLYILGVIMTAALTTGRKYTIASAVFSVLIFNFLFTHPVYTFMAYGPEYPITFAIMFLVAFITGGLTSQIKNQAKQSARLAYRTKVLLETNQTLQQARGIDSITNLAGAQLMKLMECSIVVYPLKEGKLGDPKLFLYAADTNNQDFYINKNETAVAQWVFRNNKRAGAGTNTLNGARCLYLSVRTASDVFGVIGVASGEEELGAFENSILLAVLNQCAVIFERETLAQKREEALIQVEHEKLRANLLRSISHDLRTPLTSISGSAGVLLKNHLTEQKKQALYQDIYDDAMWLINLVENLLSVTRIEDGSVALHMQTELVEEVVEEAIRHVSRDKRGHMITVVPPKSLLLAKMDAKLIMQVIINIVNNAVKYTPPHSKIQISFRKEGMYIVVEIADDGAGIPDASKEKIFDMFYTGKALSSDSRRGLGLGLALCKSIVNAHGGTIGVYDNRPHGAVFRFTLKAEEVDYHE